MTGWTVPTYSRAEVNRAGEDYIDVALPAEQHQLALVVINNWRSSHSFPLNTMQVGLRTYTSKVSDQGLIAQRLKRLNSIVLKLRRFQGMDLARMQDLGGCRAVVPSLSDVYELDRVYADSRILHKLIKRNDYINEQLREDGYRSLHRIYRYKSDRSATYNNLSIELQIRTQLQHVWATAVETAGTFTQQALKSHQGSETWLRFFSLMSAEFAYQEGSLPVPGVPAARSERRAELKALEKELEVVNRLQAYGEVLQVLEETISKASDAGYHLLELNLAGDEKTLTIRSFETRHQTRATDAYNAIETALGGGPGTDVVLVSGQSLSALRRAYPNYFADTAVFVAQVQDILSTK